MRHNGDTRLKANLRRCAVLEIVCKHACGIVLPNYLNQAIGPPSLFCWSSGWINVAFQTVVAVMFIRLPCKNVAQTSAAATEWLRRSAGTVQLSFI